jgi:hypothetical protein
VSDTIKDWPAFLLQDDDMNQKSLRKNTLYGFPSGDSGFQRKIAGMCDLCLEKKYVGRPKKGKDQ